MSDYTWLATELRKAKDYAVRDEIVSVGLIYRLDQAADAIEELSKEIEKYSDMIKRAYLIINSLLPHEEESE